MASEDVIELGSSDDEAEPAPKKAKPMTNAMVHIPRKLSGVTIQPAKSNLASLNKKLSGKPVTIKKITNVPFNLPVGEVKSNGKLIRKPVGRQVTKTLQRPIPIKQGLNPISVKMSNSQMVINKFPVELFNKPMKIPCLPIPSLPSTVTIKKALPPQKCVTANIGNKFKNDIRIINKMALLPKGNMMPKITAISNQAPLKSSVGDVLTVELDDDDTNPGPANGPQWYLRPEEQERTQKMEEQNNTEPKSSNLIEITIEDSPVKPASNKNEIGAEYAITIDDSPIKFMAGVNKSNNCSDEESKTVHPQPKSKKKLNYPKNDPAKTVEIEIEPMEVYESSQEVNTTAAVCNEDVENDETSNSSQLKEKYKSENLNVTEGCQTQCQNPESQIKGDHEFHPVYQSFIDLCFELENSDDMRKIVEKKIKGYYKQVPKEYTESEEFIDMVTSKINCMKAGPEKMYLYIKDVVDELNFKRKTLNKKAPSNAETKDTEAENFLYGEESEFDKKRQRQIRKLEKTLKKLHRAIQKLEEQEVDFDDEEDSVYLLTERYKARMICVHAKFCQLTNTKMPSEPRVHIEARPGQPTGPAKHLEKWINKKVPIGTPLPFPDFHDVLNCVREANKEDKLGWNEADIMDEARDLFIRCGKKLQRRRQENEWRLAASRISLETDPAADSTELKKKLEQNQLLAVKKETELFNKYADKQKQLKLEAEEIGDKEAEESPVESEEDDSDEEDSSLGNKEKRKETLKKLLQQKYTKISEKKESQEISNPNEDLIEDTKKKQDTDMKIENESITVETDSTQKTTRKNSTVENVQSLSDASSNMNSDIDELHLLQKLHSENEVGMSTLDSSDSESAIAISDSLDSSSESIKHPSDDVISIENSSYSETEAYVDENVAATSPAELSKSETVKEKKNTHLEIDCSNVFNIASDTDDKKKVNKSNNDEYNDSVENILLASSEEDTMDRVLTTDSADVYVNLNDDTLSIEETVIGPNNRHINVDITNTKDDNEISVEKLNPTNKTHENECNINNDGIQENNLNKDKLESKEKALSAIMANNGNVINVTSASGDNAVNADTTSGKVNEIINNECQDKQDTYCDMTDDIVDSSTEKMEVTTTSHCVAVND